MEHYKVLIVPGAEYLERRALQPLKDWVAKGGVIFTIGSSFRWDEHGQELGDDMPHVRRLDLPRNSQELLPILNTLLEPLQVTRPVLVRSASNEAVWGVEARLVRLGGGGLLFLMNHGDQPVTVDLHSPALEGLGTRSALVLDWLTIAPYQFRSERLEPLQPHVIQLPVTLPSSTGLPGILRPMPTASPGAGGG